MAVSEWRSRIRGAGLLWVTILVHKLVVLVFAFRLTRIGGAQALGVMATMGAVCWVVGMVAGQGLPDRALFLGAKEEGHSVAQEAHGRFLAGVVPAYFLVWMIGPWLGGVDDLGVFSQWLVLASAGDGLGAFVWLWLRGRGQSGPETLAHLVAACVLGMGMIVSSSVDGLGMALAAAGFSNAALAGLAMLSKARWLRPRWRLGLHREDWVYLAFGLGCWGIHNVDVLMVRALASTPDVGVLEASKMWVRPGALLTWLSVSLTLGLEDDGPARVTGRSVGILLLVGFSVGITGWFAVDGVCWAYGLAAGDVRPVMQVALLCCPLLYVVLRALLLEARRNVGSAVLTVGSGLLLTLLCGPMLIQRWGAAGAVMACGLGQALVFVRLVLCPWFAQPAPSLEDDVLRSETM